MNVRTLPMSSAIAMAIIALGTASTIGSDAKQQQLTRSIQRNVHITLIQPCVVGVGDNPFQVAIDSSDGTALDDVSVAVSFVMDAWPIKRIPETKATLSLRLAGNGRYTGTWNVSRSGHWQTTIVVKRNGTEIGRRSYILSAY